MDHEFIDVNELAKRLSVPVSRIYAETRRQGKDAIPMVKLGRYCRFSWPRVVLWLSRTKGQGSWNEQKP